MSKLQLIRPITDLCPSIPCPTPSVVFPTKSKPEHRRERKTSPSVRLKLSDIEDFDAEDLELDFAGDRENEDGLSDSDSTDSPHKIDRAALVRPHAGSITWPKKYLHNEDIINGKPVRCKFSFNCQSADRRISRSFSSPLPFLHSVSFGFRWTCLVRTTCADKGLRVLIVALFDKYGALEC